MNRDLYRDEDYRLLKLINHTGEAVFKVRKKELEKYGLSPRQTAVLFAIKNVSDKATSAEIARFLFREHHTVSGILNRMEKDGLVRKVKDPDRKGVTRIVLTDKGEQAYRESSKRDALHEIASSISEEEQEQLSLSLNKIRDAAFMKLGMHNKPPFP